MQEMDATVFFNWFATEIHTTVITTADDYGVPVTCAMDMVDAACAAAVNANAAVSKT